MREQRLRLNLFGSRIFDAGHGRIDHRRNRRNGKIRIDRKRNGAQRQAQKAEKVQIVEFTYEPDPVVVQVGGKVTWQNEDTAPHTATADDGSFDTGIIEKGKLGSATFKEPGTFTYFCEVHPTMHGTVEVVE